MKAIGYYKSLPITDENSLVDIEVEAPVIGDRDLLVEVKAISVNPVDYKIRQRVSPENGNTPKILGWDAAGIVKAIGSKVTSFAVGDEVYYAGDLTRQGSNAEFQCVDERIVGKKPKSLTFAEAAALPLTTITAWELLFDRLEVPRDNENISILIVGAAGGVGSIMTQLVKKLTKATLIASAGREKSIAWLKELGADIIINHHNPISNELLQRNITYVDYATPLIYTSQHYPEIVNVLKPQGKLGIIDDPETLDVALMKRKSISLHWEFMYTRSMFKTEDIAKQNQLLNEVSSMVDEGLIRTTVAHHFGTINAKNIRRAHQMLENHAAHGKIVLEGF